ncbi:MAG: DUF4258 domain-containing protein, partial [Candidatus Micrarchaeota archaeon]|nr:DUF4258 domain-containing protein [Candidatus Micrarchaeota archaeon]
ERLVFRKIKKAWIESCITNPDKVVDVHAGRKQAVKNVNGNIISAVYVKERHNTIVVTIFWGE